MKRPIIVIEKNAEINAGFVSTVSTSSQLVDVSPYLLDGSIVLLTLWPTDPHWAKAALTHLEDPTPTVEHIQSQQASLHNMPFVYVCSDPFNT